MNRYHSEGGASNPYFRHTVAVKDVTDEMLNWCSTFKGSEYFERYYVQWTRYSTGGAVFQFETDRAALMFNLKFGHL